MSSIAQFRLVALDCPDPQALAAFYAAITGWTIEYADEEWVQLGTDSGATIAFQLAPDHVAPGWPHGGPQQIHLDFGAADLEVAEEEVLALGAVKAESQPKPESWRVYLDPAGHPFCVVLDKDGAP